MARLTGLWQQGFVGTCPVVQVVENRPALDQALTVIENQNWHPADSGEAPDVISLGKRCEFDQLIWYGLRVH